MLKSLQVKQLEKPKIDRQIISNDPVQRFIQPGFNLEAPSKNFPYERYDNLIIPEYYRNVKSKFNTLQQTIEINQQSTRSDHQQQSKQHDSSLIKAAAQILNNDNKDMSISQMPVQNQEKISFFRQDFSIIAKIDESFKIKSNIKFNDKSISYMPSQKSQRMTIFSQDFTVINQRPDESISMIQKDLEMFECRGVNNK